MTDDEAEKFFESIYTVLVPYICEHTGFSTEIVERVLAVQADFWAERPDSLDTALQPEES